MTIYSLLIGGGGGSSLLVQPTWLGGTGTNTKYILTRTEGTASTNFTLASGNYTVKVWGGGGGSSSGGGNGDRKSVV